MELLARYNVLRTVDWAESETILSRELCPHVLKPARSGHLRTVENRVRLASSTLVFVSYGTRVIVTQAEIDSAYLVFLPQSGRSRLRIGRHEIETSGAAPRGLVIEPEIPFTIEADEEAAALVWRVDRDALIRLAGSVGEDSLASVIRFAPRAGAARGAGAAVARTLRFVAHELDAVEQHAALAPFERMEEALMLMLLEAGAGARAGRETCAASSSAIRRAEELLRVRLAESVSMAELVRVSGLSARTLFRRFRKAHGMTPMQYLRHLRLERVRRDLLRGTAVTNVTEVLSRWGIVQFGRFAGEYRRRYGELPSETLRRRLR